MNRTDDLHVNFKRFRKCIELRRSRAMYESFRFQNILKHVEIDAIEENAYMKENGDNKKFYGGKW